MNRMMHIIAAGVALSVASAYAGPNLLQNGDFEQSSCTDKTWGGYSTSSTYKNPYWTIEYSGTGGGVTVSNSTWMTGNPSVGNWCVFLQANTTGKYAACYQDLWIPEAGTYRVSLNYAARGTGYGSSDLLFTVWFDTVSGFSHSGSVVTNNIYVTSTALSTVSLDIAVSKPRMYRLQFRGYGRVASDRATIVDDVRVRLVDTTVGSDKYCGLVEALAAASEGDAITYAPGAFEPFRTEDVTYDGDVTIPGVLTVSPAANTPAGTYTILAADSITLADGASVVLDTSNNISAATTWSLETTSTAITLTVANASATDEYVYNGDFDQYGSAPGTKYSGVWGYSSHTSYGFSLPWWSYSQGGGGLAVDDSTWLAAQTNGGTYSYFAQSSDDSLAQNLGTIPRGVYTFSYNLAIRPKNTGDQQMQVQLCTNRADLIDFTVSDVTNTVFENFSTIVAFGAATPEVDVRFTHLRGSTDRSMVLDDISFSGAAVPGWSVDDTGLVTLSGTAGIPAYGKVVADMTISDGTTIEFDMADYSSPLDVSGTLSASGSITVSLSNVDDITAGTYSLVTAGATSVEGATFTATPATANGRVFSVSSTSSGLSITVTYTDYYWTGATGDNELSTLANWSTSSSETVVPTVSIGGGTTLHFTGDNDVSAANASGVEARGIVKTGAGKVTLTDFTTEGGKALSLTGGTLALAWSDSATANPFAVGTTSISATLDIGGATQEFSGDKKAFFCDGIELKNGTYNFTETTARSFQDSITAIIGEGATVNSAGGLDAYNSNNPTFVINGGKFNSTCSTYVSSFARAAGCDANLIITNGGSFASIANLQIACVNADGNVYIDNGTLDVTKAYSTDGNLTFHNSSSSGGRSDFALVNGSYLHAETIMLGKSASTSCVGRLAVTNSTISTQWIKIQDSNGTVSGSAFDLSVTFNGATIVPTAANSYGLIDDNNLYTNRDDAAFHCVGSGLCISNVIASACYFSAKMDGNAPVTIMGSGTLRPNCVQPFGLGTVSITNTAAVELAADIKTANTFTIHDGAKLSDVATQTVAIVVNVQSNGTYAVSHNNPAIANVSVEAGGKIHLSKITDVAFAAKNFTSLSMADGAIIKVDGSFDDDGTDKSVLLARGCGGLDLGNIVLDIDGLTNASSGGTRSYLALVGDELYLRRAKPALILIVR